MLSHTRMHKANKQKSINVVAHTHTHTHTHIHTHTHPWSKQQQQQKCNLHFHLGSSWNWKSIALLFQVIGGKVPELEEVAGVVERVSTCTFYTMNGLWRGGCLTDGWGSGLTGLWPGWCSWKGEHLHFLYHEWVVDGWLFDRRVREWVDWFVARLV